MATTTTPQEPHVPYRLHFMLREKQIAQRLVCQAITFDAGRRAGEPIAISTLNTLLIRRVWPRTVAANTIIEKVAAFMRANGFTEQEIADAWKPSADVPDDGPPIGRPLQGNYNFPRWRGSRVREAEPVIDEDEPFLNLEPEMLSARAREHFNITRPPFIDDVQGPSDVYLSKDQRYIRETMYQAAKHAGLIAIVGESGSGKSTLRRDLLDRLKRDSESLLVVQPKAIDKQELTTENICDAVIADLSSESPRRSREARARQVERILVESAKGGNAHVLIIEEAHDLTNDILRYLKRFWELEDGYRKLLGIILIGQPELLEKLDERKNYRIREFIRRCEIATIKPLNGNLEEYLGLKFKRIGVPLLDVFEKDAFDAIRARLTRTKPGKAEVESHLYPLVVQNLVTKCMNLAVELGLPKVNADLVGRI